MAHSSTRSSGNGNSSPTQEPESTPHIGSKRKAGNSDSPDGNPNKKTQKTLEETFHAAETAENGEPTPQDQDEPQTDETALDDTPTNGTEGKDLAAPKTSEDGETSSQDQDEPQSAKENRAGDVSANGGAIEKSADREKKAPSNIVEKGIIYFITRGRVDIDEPDSVQDLQRSYFILRPIPKGAKIGEGAIEDSKSNRLFAIPKKVLPRNGDKFMAFVEKSKASMKELKEEFFKGSEYETKTVGTRHTPPIIPIGEGVYAVTETGSTSHLVYMLTIPEKPEEVQKEMGLNEKGSFVLSLKNPTKKGPANATLPEKPDYPQDVIDDFGNRSWMPVFKSTYLDYANAQILLIGEHQDQFGSAVEPEAKDKRTDKETPREELEMLEDEDQIRVEHLHGKLPASSCNLVGANSSRR